MSLELIYVEYQGRRDFSQVLLSMDAPVYSAPRFETSDDRYSWLNKVQAIGKGVVSGEARRAGSFFQPPTTQKRPDPSQDRGIGSGVESLEIFALSRIDRLHAAATDDARRHS